MLNTYCLLLVKQMPIFGSLIFQNLFKKDSAIVCQKVYLRKKNTSFKLALKSCSYENFEL